MWSRRSQEVRVDGLSVCEACGSLFTDGVDGVDDRCALEPRTIAIWGQRYQRMTPLVAADASDTENHLARRWRVTER